MKKIKKTIAFAALLLCGNLAFATSQPELCVSLSNYGQTAVTIQTSFDGFNPPVAEANATAVLGKFWMNYCQNDICRIFLTPAGSTSPIIIDNIPRGSYIIYVKPSWYYVAKNAGVTCPTS